MSRPVVVIGAGGHAAVIADALLETGAVVLGFTDLDPDLRGAQCLGLPVLGDDGVLARYAPGDIVLANGLGFVAGSGRTTWRARVQQRLEAAGWSFVGVVHPRATVSRHAMLGPACQVLAGAVIQAGARIGTATIVNSAVVVEHDAVVGAWCHLAPRSTLCGQTRVGDGSLVGAGAVLRQSVALGVDTVVGAGAVVLKDSPGQETLCGVPARPLGTKQ